MPTKKNTSMNRENTARPWEIRTEKRFKNGKTSRRCLWSVSPNTRSRRLMTQTRLKTTV